MKNLIFKSTLIASILTAVALPRAQAYLASATTTQSAGDSTVVNRLYSDAGFTTLAPVGTTVWWVADKNNNGIPLLGQPGSAVTHDGILGVDDVLLFQDSVDGGIFGANPGKYNRTLTVPDGQNIETSSIYMILFARTAGGGLVTSPTFTPTAGGETYGALNVGINPIPQVGNASWFVTANVQSGQFTVPVAVPEPSTYALVGIGLAGLLARRLKK